MTGFRLDDVKKALKGRAPGDWKSLGPWPVGKAAAHCAQSIEYSVTGYPTRKPWLVRGLIGPLVLKKFLKNDAMSHDLSSPVPGAPEIPENLAAAEGLKRLGDAIARFEAAKELKPHFAYGPLGRDSYDRIHALHVKDHFAF